MGGERSEQSGRLIVAFPQCAAADEVWNSTQYGQSVYAADHGNVAVLTMQGSHPGSKVHIYVPGLGGNTTDRGVFIGYWIETAPGTCATSKSGPDGVSSDAWGMVRITFDKPGFPSGFTGSLGACDGAFTEEFWAGPL